MSDYKLKTPKGFEKVTEVYQKIEDTVVGTYQKIEDGVVGTYQKIEDKFVDTIFTGHSFAVYKYHTEGHYYNGCTDKVNAPHIMQYKSIT